MVLSAGIFTLPRNSPVRRSKCLAMALPSPTMRNMDFRALTSPVNSRKSSAVWNLDAGKRLVTRVIKWTDAAAARCEAARNGSDVAGFSGTPVQNDS